MCGIAGYFGSAPLETGRIARGLNALGQRGPDASGHIKSTLGGLTVEFLHTRLKIIDLDDRSNQPFEKDNCILIFNGEIYNYIEIRNELLSLGYEFKTLSDTEVLITAYLAWGIDCLRRLEGMWAFALLDKRAGKLLLSRDRFGEKPLYYTIQDKCLFFSSEPKGLRALTGKALVANTDHLKRYLVNGFRSLFKGQDTFFKNVRQIPTASVLEFSAPDDFKNVNYWKLQYRPRVRDKEDIEQSIKECLFRALKLRLRSDVPIAFCLSGGVDSTTLASIAAKKFQQEIHTFSVVDKDRRYDERENINAVVNDLSCQHYQVHVSSDGFLERMAQLTEYHDCPVPTISYYVHSFLSEAISSHGYKVAISGTAADEIFTGYYDHYAFWLAGQGGDENFPQLLEEWRKGYGQYVNNPLLQDPCAFIKKPAKRDHIYQNAALFSSFLVEPFVEPFHEENYSDELLRNRMMNELLHEVVPVILQADDSNSMMWSVENRSPYLDRELVEQLYSVPSHCLIENGYQKSLLREAGRGFLIDRVRLDKQKKGFNASIETLLDRSNEQVRDSLLSESPIFDVIKRDSVENFLKGDLKSNSFSKFMFYFISAKTFLESNILKTPQ